MQRIQARLTYYNNLLKVNGKLTDKQQLKYDKYVSELNEFKAAHGKFKSEAEVIAHKQQMIERNRERARQRRFTKPKYQFGSLGFTNIKEAKTYFNNYLTEHDGVVDDADIIAFVSNHPFGFDSNNCHVEILPNPSYPEFKNFVIVDNKTGNHTHLSLYSCITGKRKSAKSELVNVLRELIKNQIMDFRQNSSLPDVCPICQNPFIDVHVDHIYPFSAIVDDWILSKGIDIDEIEYEQVDGKRTLKNKQLISDWCSYHAQKAKLQYLCSNCNITKSNK